MMGQTAPATMYWTRQMVTEMALSYAHAAHNENGARRYEEAFFLAHMSLAWSQLAQAMTEDVRLVLEHEMS